MEKQPKQPIRFEARPDDVGDGSNIENATEEQKEKDFVLESIMSKTTSNFVRSFAPDQDKIREIKENLKKEFEAKGKKHTKSVEYNLYGGATTYTEEFEDELHRQCAEETQENIDVNDCSHEITYLNEEIHKIVSEVFSADKLKNLKDDVQLRYDKIVFELRVLVTRGKFNSVKYGKMFYNLWKDDGEGENISSTYSSAFQSRLNETRLSKDEQKRAYQTALLEVVKDLITKRIDKKYVGLIDFNELIILEKTPFVLD